MVNSIILLAAVYLIKEGIQIPIQYLSFPHVSYFIYVFAPIIMSGFCIWLSRFLGDDIISGGVLDVECANDAYLPSYLGYFFVALSISDWDTLIWIGILLLIFAPIHLLPTALCTLYAKSTGVEPSGRITTSPLGVKMNTSPLYKSSLSDS